MFAYSSSSPTINSIGSKSCNSKISVLVGFPGFKLSLKYSTTLPIAPDSLPRTTLPGKISVLSGSPWSTKLLSKPLPIVSLYVLPSTIAGASKTLPSLIIPVIMSNLASTEFLAVASVVYPESIYCEYIVW